MTTDLRGPDDLASDLEKTASVVATALRLVNDGRAVDLAALEGKVAVLCKAITALPRDQGRRFLDPLESLIRGLDLLEEALRLRFDHLLDAMDEGAPDRTTILAPAAPPLAGATPVLVDPHQAVPRKAVRAYDRIPSRPPMTAEPAPAEDPAEESPEDAPAAASTTAEDR
ncbi:hypothetical protein CKO38_14075 [Rhodospirillum rubrum]|uniref:hypothetical protein n=1 Tax=Rhodospirillum rubrum TaxID=1085 RepID=UPI001907252A|nr:hypothetical protein [Rhodospirillum rubrum]MBK1665679.1 hypothetical protein [Rhodospirillum rubrum]MBK1677776.1 hypothetical protein [Rhodospirillum rubrum]